jgi:DNA polymerase III epsilon subunit-like protein
MTSKPLVFLDSETSTDSWRTGDILELAAIRTTPQLVEQRRLSRRTHISPERAGQAEAKALEVNGYDAKVWAREAVHVRVALVEFAELLGDGDVLIVGQNTQFDWAFLSDAYARQGMAIPKTKYLLDLASMTWPLVVHGHLERIALEHVCERYGISNDGAHRAIVDVERTVRAYAKVLGFKPPTFKQHADELVGEGAASWE